MLASRALVHLVRCLRIRSSALSCLRLALAGLLAAAFATIAYRLIAKALTDPSAGIVRILHQSWKDSSLPPRFRRWSQSFSACLPNWERRLWTDVDNEKLVETHFPKYLATYRQMSLGVQRADWARLFYMYKYGGVYCDMDCDCLQPFEHLLAGVSLAFGAMEGHAIGPTDYRYVEEGQIENSFMYSLPGHPFIKHLIKQVAKYPSGTPEDTTGPYLIMREIHRLRNSSVGIPRKFRGKKFLEIFPPSYFNPFSWIMDSTSACKEKGNFSRTEEEKCRETHQKSSYILQYHTQVWQGGSAYQNRD